MGCSLVDFYERKDFLNPNQAKFKKEEEVFKLLELILGVSVMCTEKEFYIQEIQNNLDQKTQNDLVVIIQNLRKKYVPAKDDLLSPPKQSSISVNVDDMQANID